MKNLFLLVAVIFLTVFTGSAQISVVEQQGSTLKIKKLDGSNSYVGIAHWEFLGYSSSVIAVKSSRDTIKMYDSNGNSTGQINYIRDDWYFQGVFGNEVRLKTNTSIRRYSASGQYIGEL